MTAIIGWQNDLVASAALLIDGEIVGAVEEERFTRVKQQTGFPGRSVTWLLDAVSPDLVLQAEGIIRWVAESVAAGKVVGVVQGRAGFGPRALGHRSILADPSDAAISDTLNAPLSRTEFMPFAPILRAEDALRSLRGWSSDDPCAPFMTMAYECTPSFSARHAAVVHVDGTARPQVVTADSDPWMHQVLGDYHRTTGRWSLLNTSLNRHEEPIILTIGDGLAALADGTVDAVVDRVIVRTTS